MQTFVIIFRQKPNQLSATDLGNRQRETSAWAKACNAAGHHLVPHILGDEGRRIAPNGDLSLQTSDDTNLTALLFIEADGLQQAIEIARAHPGLKYGASIEVRSWAPPQKAAA